MVRNVDGEMEILWGYYEDPAGNEIAARFNLTPGEYLLLSADRKPIQKGFFPALSKVRKALSRA